MFQQHNGGMASRAGISLIEVVVSTVIVAFVITAAMQTVANAVTARSRTYELQLGPSLARGLMGEITKNPYSDPDTLSSSIGTETGEGINNRADFDDVDDFDGWSSASPVKPDGTAIPVGAGWQRSVSVSFLEPATLSITSSDMGLKKIVVTATSPSGKATVLEALKSSFGANERQPHADRTIVSSVSVGIEMTSGETAEYSQVFSRNHAQDE